MYGRPSFHPRLACPVASLQIIMEGSCCRAKPAGSRKMGSDRGQQPGRTFNGMLAGSYFLQLGLTFFKTWVFGEYFRLKLCRMPVTSQSANLPVSGLFLLICLWVHLYYCKWQGHHFFKDNSIPLCQLTHFLNSISLFLSIQVNFVLLLVIISVIYIWFICTYSTYIYYS